MGDEVSPQQYRLHILDEDERLLSNDIYPSILSSGAAVSIKGKLWRVVRTVPHKTLPDVNIVHVDLDAKHVPRKTRG